MLLDFLALVQAAYRESGYVGAGPVSVLNQTGRNADVVKWVLQAHEEIQAARPDWSFDWATGTFTLNSGQDTYDPDSDFGVAGGIATFARTGAYAYPTAQGVNGRLWLEYLEWEIFRQLTVPVVPGIPNCFTRRPDGDVQYYPRPNAAMTAVHEYWKHAETLAADTDEPRMPAAYHMAIVWKAVMIGCGKTKDWTRFDSAEEQFEILSQRMTIRETPQLVTGGPLA